MFFYFFALGELSVAGRDTSVAGKDTCVAGRDTCVAGGDHPAFISLFSPLFQLPPSFFLGLAYVFSKSPFCPVGFVHPPSACPNI